MIAKEFPSPFPASPGKHALALPVCRGAADVLDRARPADAPPSLDPALIERWRGYLGRIGAPDAVGQQLARLESGAWVVVAGQQAGLLTGPLYTVLKAARAVSLARELEAALGVAVVPVFWIAADDHDLGEINHTFVRARSGELRRLRLAVPDHRQPAGRVVVPPEAKDLVRELAEVAGHSVDDARLAQLLPAPGETLSCWFARCLLALLGRAGLVPLEPELLGASALPLYASILERPARYREALARGAEVFRAVGLEEPLPLDPDTPLFCIDARGRHRLQIRGARFRVHDEDYTAEELLAGESRGLRLSADASLRPLLQNATLPVLAAVGGPAELHYWAQLVPLHEAYAVPLPAAVARPSTVILDRAAMRALRKLPLPWEELFPALQRSDRSQVPPVVPEAERIQSHLEDCLRALEEAGGALWASCSRRAEHLRRGFSAFLDALRQAAQEGEERAHLRWTGLESLVMPRGQPQDRVLNVVPFWLEHGEPLLETLLTLSGRLDTTWLLAPRDGEPGP